MEKQHKLLHCKMDVTFNYGITVNSFINYGVQWVILMRLWALYIAYSDRDNNRIQSCMFIVSIEKALKDDQDEINDDCISEVCFLYNEPLNLSSHI